MAILSLSYVECAAENITHEKGQFVIRTYRSEGQTIQAEGTFEMDVGEKGYATRVFLYPGTDWDGMKYYILSDYHSTYASLLWKQRDSPDSRPSGNVAAFANLYDQPLPRLDQDRFSLTQILSLAILLTRDYRSCISDKEQIRPNLAPTILRNWLKGTEDPLESRILPNYRGSVVSALFGYRDLKTNLLLDLGGLMVKDSANGLPTHARYVLTKLVPSKKISPRTHLPMIEAVPFVEINFDGEVSSVPLTDQFRKIAYTPGILAGVNDYREIRNGRPRFYKLLPGEVVPFTTLFPEAYNSLRGRQQLSDDENNAKIRRAHLLWVAFLASVLLGVYFTLRKLHKDKKPSNT